MLINGGAYYQNKKKKRASCFDRNRISIYWFLIKLRSAGSFPGKVQHLKSAIHGLPVTLHMLRVMSDKYDGLRSKNRTPEVTILGVDQKELGLREPQVTQAQ